MFKKKQEEEEENELDTLTVCVTTNSVRGVHSYCNRENDPTNHNIHTLTTIGFFFLSLFDGMKNHCTIYAANTSMDVYLVSKVSGRLLHLLPLLLAPPPLHLLLLLLLLHSEARREGLLQWRSLRMATSETNQTASAAAAVAAAVNKHATLHFLDFQQQQRY